MNAVAISALGLKKIIAKIELVRLELSEKELTPAIKNAIAELQWQKIGLKMKVKRLKHEQNFL